MIKINFSTMAYSQNKNNQVMIFNGTNKSIIPHTVSPQLFAPTLQSKAYRSRGFIIFYQSIQKMKDLTLNFMVQAFQFFKTLRLELNGPFFSHPRNQAVFWPLSRKYWALFLPSEKGLKDSLLAHLNTALRPVQHNSFWSDGSFQINRPICVQPLWIILRKA